MIFTFRKTFVRTDNNCAAQWQDHRFVILKICCNSCSVLKSWILGVIYLIYKREVSLVSQTPRFFICFGFGHLKSLYSCFFKFLNGSIEQQFPKFFPFGNIHSIIISEIEISLPLNDQWLDSLVSPVRLQHNKFWQMVSLDLEAILTNVAEKFLSLIGLRLN